MCNVKLKKSFDIFCYILYYIALYIILYYIILYYIILYYIILYKQLNSCKCFLSRCLKTTMESKLRISTGSLLKQDVPWN